MYIKNGFNKEMTTNTTKEFLPKFFLKVFAEEKAETNETKAETSTETKEETTETKNTSINYEDLISRARKEEKDKLYPKISALEKEKNDLVEKVNSHLLTIGELQVKLEDMTTKANSTGKSESQVVTDLQTQLTSALDELKVVKESTISVEEVEQRVRDEVVGEYEIKLYREQKLREVGNNVIPELIFGSTKEEIDNSIANSQDRYNQIIMDATKGIKIPPANASTSKLNAKEFSMEDIMKLDPRSTEYKELRGKLGLK